MAYLDPTIRNAVRAVIVRSGRVLLLRKQGGGRGERFALPGGAQESGETLEEALQRECLEEIGTEVAILDLLHLADYFKQRDTVPPSTRQLVEFLFLCDVPPDYQAGNGARPDKHQVEVIWAPVSEVASMILLPASLSRILASVAPGEGAGGVYLGTID